MGTFGVQILGFVFVLLPLCALIVMATVALVSVGRRGLWRRIATVLGCYFLCNFVVGGYAYAAIPADYTRFHRWTWHPAASALGEQHGHALNVAEVIHATNPEEAATLREQVQRERRIFLSDWLHVMVPGLVALTSILLGWHFIGRGRDGERSSSSSRAVGSG